MVESSCQGAVYYLHLPQQEETNEQETNKQEEMKQEETNEQETNKQEETKQEETNEQEETNDKLLGTSKMPGTGKMLVLLYKIDLL